MINSIYARVFAKPISFPTELDLHYRVVEKETGEYRCVYGLDSRFSWDEVKEKFSIDEIRASRCEALLRRGRFALVARAREWEGDWGVVKDSSFSVSIYTPGTTQITSAWLNGFSHQSTNYTLQSSDNHKCVLFKGSAAETATLPQPGTSGIDSNFAAWIANATTGTVKIMPTHSTIDGASSLALPQNQGVVIFTDGTNYFTDREVQ